MSTTLNEYLCAGSFDDELQPEMRPDRIGGGKLISLTVRVQVEGPKSSPKLVNSCLPASRAETSGVSGTLSGVRGANDSRRFMHWLGDSLDTDTPTLILEVVSADGSTQIVQAALKRLAAQALG
jgi:hypothetical protein